MPWEEQCILFISILLLFIPLTNSASLKEIEPIPTYYNYYWDDSPFLLPTDLVPLLDALWLDEARIPTEEEVNSLLSRRLGQGASNFSHEAKLIGDAHKLSKSARINAEKQKLLIVGESIMVIGGAVTSVASAPEVGVPTAIIGASMYTAYSMNEARGALDQAFRALEKTASAANSAFDKAAVEADKLEFAGAGYENYTGKASGTYNKLNEFISLSRQANASLTASTSQEYPYLNALSLSKSIKASLAEKDIQQISSSHALSKSLNSLASEDGGAFMQLAELYAEIKTAQSEMFSEYSELENMVEEKQGQLRAEEKKLKDDDLQLVDSGITQQFGSGGWSTSTASPKEKIRELNYLLNGRGVSPSAIQLLENARDLRGKKPKYYLARAIEKLENARALLSQAETLSQAIRDDADSLLSNAIKIESARRIKTDLLLATFQASNEEETKALERASALRAKAYPPTGTKGRQLLQLSENLEIYSKVIALLSQNRSSQSSTLQNSTRSALDELEKEAQTAEEDGLNVDYEKDFTESANSLAESAAEDALEAILEEAEKTLAELRARYGNELDELNARRAELLLLSSKLEDELPSLGLGEDFANLKQLDEQFARNGELDQQLSEASHSLLNSSYSLLESKIASNAQSILSKHLSKNARTQLVLDETPVLDEETSASLFISLENDLGLSTNGKPFYAIIPLQFDLPPSTQLVSKSDEIMQFSSSSGKLLLLLEKAESHSAFHASFKFSKKFAETISKTSTMLSLNERELRKRTLVKFHSAIQLERLDASLPLSSLPSHYRAVFEERDVPIHVSGVQDYHASITLSNIPEGDNVLMLEYTLPDPYNVSLKDIRVVPNGSKATVIYDVELKNNGQYLQNVPVDLLEPSNSTLGISTVNVSGTCTDPKNVSAKQTELGASIHFECPSLPEKSSCRFPVSFTVEDMNAYANALASDLRPAIELSGNSELEKQFSQAMQLLEDGASDEAIRRLLAVREQARVILSSNDSKRTDFLDAEINSLSEQANEPSSLSQQLAEEAKALMEKNDLGNASKKAAQAFFYANDSNQDNNSLLRDSIISTRNALWLELNNLKNKNAVLTLLDADTALITRLVLQSEASFQQLNAFIEKQDYSSSFTLAFELNASLKNISRQIDFSASAFLSNFISAKASFEASSSKAERLFTQLNKALEITVQDVSKKHAFSPSFDPALLESKFRNNTRHLQKTFQLAETNSGNPGILFNYSNDFSIALRELNELNETSALLQGEYSLLSSRANRSVELGLLSLKQLDELASGNEQFSRERERLFSLMEQAGESLALGRFNDALIVSSFVQDYARKMLDASPRKPPETANSNELAILAVSAIFFLILIALFVKSRGKGESETKKLLQKIGKEN